MSLGQRPGSRQPNVAAVVVVLVVVVAVAAAAVVVVVVEANLVPKNLLEE